MPPAVTIGPEGAQSGLKNLLAVGAGKAYLCAASGEADEGGTAALLARAGVNRITTPGHMSDSFPLEAHDGEYPLRRYVRVVDMENPRGRTETAPEQENF